MKDIKTRVINFIFVLFCLLSLALVSCDSNNKKSTKDDVKNEKETEVTASNDSRNDDEMKRRTYKI